MRVIIEGPDGSGKSTLAKRLSESLGWPLLSSRGPYRTQQDFERRIAEFEGLSCAIFDRHPIISEPIYGRFRDSGPWQTPSAVAVRFYERADQVIIYCHGEFRHHPRPDETKDHLDMVTRNERRIRQTYEDWAMSSAHVIFRPLENNYARLERMLIDFDPVADILEFHEKFGFPQVDPDGPAPLPPELSEFRIKFLGEELSEYVEATSGSQDLLINEPDSELLDAELENMLDAMVDLVYVALGTSHLHGFPFREAWRRVHRANMAKVRAQSADDSKRNSSFDVVKPKGWRAPSLRDLVTRGRDE